MRTRVMRCATTGLLVVATMSAAAHTDDPERKDYSASPTSPPITITINPEARVSVALAGPLPSPAACGTAVVFRLKIINKGFVTARLEAELVEDKPAGVTLSFHPEPLTGALEEQRDLRITLMNPGPTDLTISFRTHNNAPDLGGRDRVHFLMECGGDTRSGQPSPTSESSH